MQDFIIVQAVSTVLFLIQRGDAQDRSKWRRSLLKVFKAIAQAFPQDQEFIQAAKSAQAQKG